MPLQVACRRRKVELVVKQQELLDLARLEQLAVVRLQVKLTKGPALVLKKWVHY